MSKCRLKWVVNINCENMPTEQDNRKAKPLLEICPTDCVSQLGAIFPQGGVWQHLETFVIVTIGVSSARESSG